MARLLALALLAACGRLGFDATASGRDGAIGDGAMGDGAAIDAPGFCATMPAATFCSDFDDGLGTSAWSSTTTLRGSFQIDGEARSGSSALRVDSVALATGETAEADLFETGLPVAYQVTAQFAVFVDTVDTSEPIMFELRMDDGITNHAFEIVYRAPPALPYVEDATGPSGMSATSYMNYTVTAELTPSAWHVVELDYMVGPTAHLAVRFDGATVLDMVPNNTTGGASTVVLGISYLNGPAQPWQLHFDNFAISFQ